MLNLSPFFRTTLALLGATLLTATLSAQQPAPVRDYSPSDATSEVLPKYKAMIDAKPANYEGAIAILDAQLAKVAADSYDAALIYQLKTQTLLQKGDFSASIEPMERGLVLSEAKTPTFFDERITRELYYFLAQLYFQEATLSKNPSLVASFYDKSDKAMIHWLKLAPKSSAEAQMFYSQMLYSRAIQNPEHPDLEIVKRALEQIDIGLHMSSHPKDNFYLLKLVSLQQLNRNVEAAEMLELMLKQKPDSGTYWQQLAALYLSAGQDIRAILTIERAQANGLMNTPQYYYNLVGIYFNLGHYEKAAELLESGLKNGHIENEPKNWELLALAYQQLQQPYKQIEALKAASKAFPKSGQILFNTAQAYHALEKPEEALSFAQAAVTKGELTKPHQVYLFIAYMAYEVKKYDIALEAAKKAAAIPDGAKDGANMVRAIEEIIQAREAKKNKT